jgi:hypothetical protein
MIFQVLWCWISAGLRLGIAHSIAIYMSNAPWLAECNKARC